MAKSKPNKPKGQHASRDRVDLRADPEWISRVEAQAERLGLGLSAYIRMAVTERLERDEATQPKQAGEK